MSEIKKDINNNEVLVKAEHITMSFSIPQYRYDTLKERVVGLLRGKINHKKKVNVLDDISFTIKRGQSLGVIGHNGAGKSTLLRIVSNIYRPTSGTISTKGQIVLLSLGAGFDMEADAEENVYINGALLGFSHKEMKEKMDSILEFAELKNFTHLPLKNYSSGMVSRLGFAIAINVHPDLLLVDEVLSVGDQNFKEKCMKRIMELKNSGVSFLFVSHAIPQVKALCEITLWIENSKVQEYGPSNVVCDHYLAYCKSLDQKQIKK